MTRGIVIAVDASRSTFAVETQEGVCAVFCQHAGPVVQAGDILEGPVISRGTRILGHVDGMCAAVGDSGPVSREEALAYLQASAPCANGFERGDDRGPGAAELGADL
jgi:hypothetical protein